MATHNSSEGIIKIGSDTLGELRSYSISQTAGTIETTTLSDAAKTYTAGQTSFSGSAEAYWDEADAAQTSITVGSSLTISFYAEGASSGDKFYTGTVLVTEVGVSAATDGIVETSFSFTGTGALALSTVS
jgi:hypothetical protein